MSTSLPKGIGTAAEVDQANRWLKEQPWYQAQLAAWGVSPQRVQLSDGQRDQLLAMARQRGVGISDHFAIDGAGNIHAQGHALRNTLIGAGLTAAAIFGAPAVAGLFAGGGGPAGGIGADAALGGITGGAGAGTAGLTGFGAGAGVLAGGGGATGAGMSIPWGDLTKGGMSLFGNLFGAHMQTASADRAAQIQAEAAKYAADLQAKAAAEALGFTKSQAENAYLNSEVARRGNYDQWAAAQRRLGTVGDLLGFGPREIPAYVAGVDPHFDGGGSSPAPASPSNGSPSGGSIAMPEGIDPRLAAVYQQAGMTPTGRGTGAGDWQYYQTEALHNANGDWGWLTGRLAADIAKERSGISMAGGAAPTTTTRSLPRVAPVSAYFRTPTLDAPIAPALSIPNPYTVAPVSAYL